MAKRSLTGEGEGEGEGESQGGSEGKAGVEAAAASEEYSMVCLVRSGQANRAGSDRVACKCGRASGTGSDGACTAARERFTAVLLGVESSGGGVGAVGAQQGRRVVMAVLPEPLQPSLISCCG